MATKKTTIVFSINVHEHFNFLRKQIEDIEANVLLDYVIIINANEYMYNEIINSGILNEKTYIELYPEYVNKKHYHGSLTKGICLNMEYAVKNYQFEYFVILSSRNLFYNKLHNDNYKNMRKICDGMSFEKIIKHEWHWPMYFQTKLSECIIMNNLIFSKSYEYHEGLTFDYISSLKIVEFLQNNEVIKNNLFEFNCCVEEFALQTISLNLNGYYYQIGNSAGPGEDDYDNIDTLPKDLFVYKTIRK